MVDYQKSIIFDTMEDYNDTFDFTERVLSRLSDRHLDMVDFFKHSKSHLGYLLTINDQEFKDGYTMVSKESMADVAGNPEVIGEAVVIMKYIDGMDSFSVNHVIEKVKEMIGNYTLISLTRKGLINYTIGEKDEDWKFTRKKDNAPVQIQFIHPSQKDNPEFSNLWMEEE